MAIGAAHQALRTATAVAHERLDALYARFDLTDRDDYAAFLQAHAAALLPVEDWLDSAGAAQVAADWPARRRNAALIEDLAELGVACPPARPFTDAADTPAVAGVLYVIEGSRLGGRYLARALPAGFPRRFLAPAVQPSWPALLAGVDRALASPADHPAAIDAALRVFDQFEATGHAEVRAR